MRKTAETDDDAAEAEAEAGPPLDLDLNATVALSEDMLAALLEEVKRTRSAPLRADGTPGPALTTDDDDPTSISVAEPIHDGEPERDGHSEQDSEPSRNQSRGDVGE